MKFRLSNISKEWWRVTEYNSIQSNLGSSGMIPSGPINKQRSCPNVSFRWSVLETWSMPGKMYDQWKNWRLHWMMKPAVTTRERSSRLHGTAQWDWQSFSYVRNVTRYDHEHYGQEWKGAATQVITSISTTSGDHIMDDIQVGHTYLKENIE